MSAYYQRQDLRHYVSTTPEASQGDPVDEADFDMEIRLSDEQIAESIKRTPYNLCGGEGYTDATDEQKDATLALSRVATPDAVGWFEYYLLGGGAGYSVTGVADPYTHEFRAIQAPDYLLDSFSVVETFKGSGEQWIYRGGQMASGRISGSLEQKIVRLEGQPEFAGERAAITLADPPECVPEQAYRFESGGSTVINFGKYGEAAWSGLKHRGFTLGLNNNLETLDEAERANLYVVTRDRGDRSDGGTLTVSVLGKKGDATDLAFHVGDFVYWNIKFTNLGANREWYLGVLKAKIMRKREGWSTSVNKSTHEFDLALFRDSTSPTTEARWPWYSTLESGRPTFAAAP